MSSVAGSGGGAKPLLRGVVFDMDGTLTVPNLDFKVMYERCGVDASDDLLAAIAAMPADKAAVANAVIDEMEAEGRRTLQLEKGVAELARWLQFHNVPTALVTRNSAITVEHFQQYLWEPAGLPRFEPAISRDDEGVLPKPNPDAMEVIAKKWGFAIAGPGGDAGGDAGGGAVEDGVELIDGADLIMIGDSPSNDIVFGKAAGVTTALVDSGRRFVEGGSDQGADFRVDSLALLPHLLWQRFQIAGAQAGPLVKYPPPPPPTNEVSVVAAEGDLEKLEALGTDADLEEADNTNGPLVWAAENGHAACVELLIGRHANLDAPGYLGATAVNRAARRGHTDCLELLLAAGANPDLPNVKLQHPLHFAAFKKNPDAVDCLLKYGASTLVLDRKGRTPAEDTSDEAIRETLLAARAKALSNRE